MKDEIDDIRESLDRLEAESQRRKNKLLEQVGNCIYITTVVIISTIIIILIVVKKNKTLEVDININFIVTDIFMIMVMVIINVINKNRLLYQLRPHIRDHDYGVQTWNLSRPAVV